MRQTKALEPFWKQRKKKKEKIDKDYLLNFLMPNANVCFLNDWKCQGKLARADIFFHYTVPIGLIFLFL